MKAVNDYIVIEKIKEQKTTSGGLLLTDDTDTDNRSVSYTHLTLPTTPYE